MGGLRERAQSSSSLILVAGCRAHRAESHCRPDRAKACESGAKTGESEDGKADAEVLHVLQKPCHQKNVVMPVKGLSN